MKKNIAIIGVLIIVLVVAGIKLTSKTTPQQPTTISSGSVVVATADYTIGSETQKHTQIYGVVVASNLSSIVSSVAGVVSSLSCTPGTIVKRGQVISTITPANDLQRENSHIQQGFLQQQISLGEQGIQATLNNITIQINSLNDQKRTNNDQLILLQNTLTNLQQQQNITLDDTNTRIINTEKSLQNNINNALTLFDQTFGITNPSKVLHTDAYLGANNPSAKADLKTLFPSIKARNEQFDTMSTMDARNFMVDATNFFSTASQVVVDSIVDDQYLPKSQLDILYKTFTDIANNLLSAKSTFDTLLTSVDTTPLSYRTQINQLQAQINSTKLSLDSLNDQIAALENTREIQTQQSQSQILTNQQTLSLLQNNLNGERLVAPFDGIVKSAAVQLSNKVTAGTLICQITPTNMESVKIQVFSPDQIPHGTVVYFYDEQYTLIASGALVLELPYKDAPTQNYIYEFSAPYLRVKEGAKLKVIFDQSLQSTQVRVPLSYVTPKLEGYFITKKQGSGTQEVQVEVGDIDNGMAQILSGIQQGDTITK